jgi:hypothetical protein
MVFGEESAIQACNPGLGQGFGILSILIGNFEIGINIESPNFKCPG